MLANRVIQRKTKIAKGEQVDGTCLPFVPFNARPW